MNFKKRYISLVKFIIIIITLAFNNGYSFQNLAPEEDEYNNVTETEFLLDELTQIIISYGPQRFEEAIDWLLLIADFNLVTMAINRLCNHHNGSI